MAAETKISELGAAGSLSGAEIFEIVQSGANKQLALNLITALASLASVGVITSGTWNAKTKKRVQSLASAANVTPDADSDDLVRVTALAVDMTLEAPTGSPTDGQVLDVYILDAGVGKNLTLNAIYRAIGVTLPTGTTAGKRIYLRAIYNDDDTKWDVVDVKEEV